VKPVNTKLTRDPRYIEATERLTALKTESNDLERQRSEVETGLSRYPSERDLITNEATALLDGTSEKATRRTELMRNREQLAHRLQVVREAIEIQRGRVATLTTEISAAICKEIEPEHRRLVAEVAAAVLVLAEASQAEADLREQLTLDGVLYSAHLRPMAAPGFLVSDPHCRAAHYLIEAAQHGYISESSLPAIYRKWIPPKETKKPAPKAQRNAEAQDGWEKA